MITTFLYVYGIHNSVDISGWAYIIPVLTDLTLMGRFSLKF